MQEFETVIGLEVHLQFNTKTKIFCGCENVFGKDPNEQTCPVCLGLPGTLPVVNETAIQYAVKVALALDCKVNPFIKFDRKNYYYPDLPKGYQISQFDLPIASNGFIMVPSEGELKKIRIHRAHIEEDAGKLIHDASIKSSLVDYNRTGTPLMEIVSEADIRSPQEAYDYLTMLKLTLQYLNVSDCDMEKGSLRCDANISQRPKGQKEFGTKAELKNMNSFKAVKVALEYEEKRQRELLSSGEKVIQESRLWDEKKEISVAMRSKEEAHDYRYFPEPDLVPFTLKTSLIDDIKSSIPEMPLNKLERFKKDYQLTDYDSQLLIQDQKIANFFEECTTFSDKIKKICNWINGSILQELNTRKRQIDEIPITPKRLTTLIEKVEEGAISNLAAKDVLKGIIDEDKEVEAIIESKGLAQVSDTESLESIVVEILNENPEAADEIRNGKENAIGFLVGQAMKKTQGKANPKLVGEMIKRRLTNESS